MDFVFRNKFSALFFVKKLGFYALTDLFMSPMLAVSLVCVTNLMGFASSLTNYTLFFSDQW